MTDNAAKKAACKVQGDAGVSCTRAELARPLLEAYRQAASL